MAYKTRGTFASQRMGREDASGQDTDIAKQGHCSRTLLTTAKPQPPDLSVSYPLRSYTKEKQVPPPPPPAMTPLPPPNVGAAVSVMSSGKPHQSQYLQTWSCGLMAQP